MALRIISNHKNAYPAVGAIGIIWYSIHTLQNMISYDMIDLLRLALYKPAVMLPIK